MILAPQVLKSSPSSAIFETELYSERYEHLNQQNGRSGNSFIKYKNQFIMKMHLGCEKTFNFI